MSGPPKLRSTNVPVDSEERPILGPAGNKTRTLIARKPSSNPVKKEEKTKVCRLSSEKESTTVPVLLPADSSSSSISSPSTPEMLDTLSAAHPSNILERNETLHSSRRLNLSRSSEALTDSGCRHTSSGRTDSARNAGITSRWKQCAGKKPVRVVPDGFLHASTLPPSPPIQFRKRCAWVTANSDPCYVTFHDEEWGFPVHDDKKLFEYLSLSGGLSELTWSSILGRRRLLREMFFDFEPELVAKLNQKNVVARANTGSPLLSELKLRCIIDNARQILNIIEEFGSFESYCWSFVHGRPIVNSFRHGRQVPVKSPKTEVISKDMVRRGLRSVSPTAVYTFMQVAGITNDHLEGCYRFGECNTGMKHKQSEIRNSTPTKPVENLHLSTSDSLNGTHVAFVDANKPMEST